jgi:hypothetical protein
VRGGVHQLERLSRNAAQAWCRLRMMSIASSTAHTGVKALIARISQVDTSFRQTRIFKAPGSKFETPGRRVYVPDLTRHVGVFPSVLCNASLPVQ